MSNRPLVVSASLISVAAVIALLALGKPLLLPFAIAVMIWYVIDAMASSFERLEVGGIHPLARVSKLLAVLTILFLIIGVANMVGNTVNEVANTADSYKDNIQNMVDKLSASLGIEVDPVIKDFAAQIHYGAAVSRIAGGITSLAGDAGMVVIYLIFLMIEQHLFSAKLGAMFRNPDNEARARSVVNDIQTQIRHYIALKTWMSAATGLLSYVILLWVGVDYAAFWAFLIFLLNYIPTVGSLLGVAFPAVLALVQFDTFVPFFQLLAALGLVQMVIGNFIEPRLMGASLNLSPLVVILSLSLWGQLWGVTGMFLSVPMTVILMIVLAHFEGSRWIAVALSADGKLQHKTN